MGTAAVQWRETIPPHCPCILRMGLVTRPGRWTWFRRWVSSPPGPAPAAVVPVSELGGGAATLPDADRKISACCSF